MIHRFFGINQIIHIDNNFFYLFIVAYIIIFLRNLNQYMNNKSRQYTYKMTIDEWIKYIERYFIVWIKFHCYNENPRKNCIIIICGYEPFVIGQVTKYVYIIVSLSGAPVFLGFLRIYTWLCFQGQFSWLLSNCWLFCHCLYAGTWGFYHRLYCVYHDKTDLNMFQWI